MMGYVTVIRSRQAGKALEQDLMTYVKWAMLFARYPALDKGQYSLAERRKELINKYGVDAMRGL